ncbi:hypothetical protein JR316_0006241 [Psilocybe cubensis]|uniref:Uncharacterized protein n=1 Tax=Psilocybe cubensis TaxID=181762 RepID=A0ACB8H3A9_PSICU|nr:hypothetical protein JR316_0006241 [Psilocybe cubensis]KAH9481714.1 hypothetical protein JR316_0006241 [Psilocybe cubensis]
MQTRTSSFSSLISSLALPLFLAITFVPEISASVPRHDFVPIAESPTLTSPSASASATDFAAACYASPLPASSILPPSTDNRTVPWGTPSIIFPNGTTCCASLDDVRAGIDAVDDQILALLAQRAAYVREATRFKATRDTVDVPARDQQVIDGAVASAASVHLPATIAGAVFESIISANVPFEECVVSSL